MSTIGAMVALLIALLVLSWQTQAQVQEPGSDDLSSLFNQMQKDQALRQANQQKQDNARRQRIIQGCRQLKALPIALLEEYASTHRIDPRSVSLVRTRVIGGGLSCEVTLYSPIGACRYGVWFSETPPIVPIRLMDTGFQEGCRDRS